MSLTKLCFLVVVVVIMITFFKQENPKWAFVLKLAFSVCLGYFVIDRFMLLLEQYEDTLECLQKYSVYVKLFLKALGISYICEFVANIAKEEGQVNLGAQIELLGKLSVFSLGVPVLITLFEYLESFM